MHAHNVRLEVLTGSQKGQRFGLEPGTYRVLGRQSGSQDSTMQLTLDGDRALDPDRQQLVDRAVHGPARSSTRVRGSARRRAADLELADNNVSRTHAMIFLDEEGNASVVDLMSTNGTTVNEQQVQDADLQVGDVIQVGATRLRLVTG